MTMRTIAFHFAGVFSVVSFLFPSHGLFGQMPPHPHLAEEIRLGRVPIPYVLAHGEELRSRGIDAPWASDALELQQTGGAPDLFTRSLGPAAGPTGSWKALVILVEFSDNPAQVAPVMFDSLLFGVSMSTLRDYYKKVSYGALDIVTVNFPSAIDWVTAPQTYAYYVNGLNGTGTYPQNTQKLTEDVVALVNPVVNFSQYDNNADGYVDALFIVHAGRGAEYTGNANDIWSHAWVTKTPQLLDGVYVYRYSTEPEYWSTPGDMTCGVYAHELGHAAFGLMDLYDTDNSSEGLGRWSLMASGSWNGTGPGGNYPSFPDAWSHAQMGYLVPSTVASNVTGLAIRDKAVFGDAFRVWTLGNPVSQYFMIENRQQSGYDTYLPGNGLLIYHVDQSVATGNTKEWYPGYTAFGHYKVALEQADGLWQMEKYANRGDAGDPYPGSTLNNEFSFRTIPDSRDYASNLTKVSIGNISGSAATMTADILVDADEAGLVVISPNGGESWPVGEIRSISWEAVNVTGLVRIEYSTDNGGHWLLVDDIDAAGSAAQTASFVDGLVETELESDLGSEGFSSGSYPWLVPDTRSAACLVKVTSLALPSYSDVSNGPFSIVVAIPGLWTLQFNYDALTVTGGDGNFGALYIPTLNEFWTSRWSTNLMHRWTRDGALIGAFTMAGVSGVRGMTFDGTYVYATTNTTTIHAVDPLTRAVVSTITAPLAIRYVAFDPTANLGAGGFWVGNATTDVYLISRAGTVLRTLPYASLNSALNYGAAYDGFLPGGPYLWLWGQGDGLGAPQRIVQIELATGLPTGVEHDVTSDVGSGLAGGLFVSDDIVPGTSTIGGLIQSSNRLFGYQLTATGVVVRTKAFLEGAFDTVTARMSSRLRDDGVLAAHFGFSTIPAAAVDSVSIEIRDSLTAGASTQDLYAPAWLMADGSIRDFTDTTRNYVEFPLPSGPYYLILRHRNHLGICSAWPVPVGLAGVPHDFAASMDNAYGSGSMKLRGGWCCMIAGDANGDGQVTSSDFNDFLPKFTLGATGYQFSDWNLDGQVTSTDFNLFLANFTSGRATEVP